MNAIQDATQVRYEVMLCAVDQYGKVIVHAQARPLYGYHHIYKVDSEGTKWPIAMVDSDVKPDQVMKIAKILAAGRQIDMFEYVVPE